MILLYNKPYHRNRGNTMYFTDTNEKMIFALDGVEQSAVVCAMPIISEGDVLGAVMSICDENTARTPDEVEIKLIQTAAVFLGKQLEE